MSTPGCWNGIAGGVVFRGILVSDGFGISRLELTHHVAASKAEAARKALKAGIDFELDSAYSSTLISQVKDGTVPEALIDTAVRRVLRAKFLLGLFDGAFADADEAEQVSTAPSIASWLTGRPQKASSCLRMTGCFHWIRRRSRPWQ